MAIPDFQSLMNPVLNLYKKKNVELRPRDIEDEIAELFNLSEEDKNQMIPSSNTETLLRNRVNWAVYYLFRAGLLDRPKRGYYKISEAGIQEHKTGNKINIESLKKFPSFVDFSNIENKKSSDSKNSIENNEFQTPDEMISKAQAVYSDNLQNELLEKLKQVDPVKFEK